MGFPKMGYINSWIGWFMMENPKKKRGWLSSLTFGFLRVTWPISSWTSCLHKHPQIFIFIHFPALFLTSYDINSSFWPLATNFLRHLSEKASILGVQTPAGDSRTAKRSSSSGAWRGWSGWTRWARAPQLCSPDFFDWPTVSQKCQKALAKFPSPDVYTFRANHLDHPTISRVQSVTSRTIHPLRTCRDTFRNEPVASSKLSHVYLSLLSVKIEDSDMRWIPKLMFQYGCWVMFI